MKKQIFEDEYLYPKKQIKAKKIQSRDVDFYLVDWNGNDQFGENEIDYIGIKPSLENRPFLTKNDSLVVVKIDGVNHKLVKDDDDFNVVSYGGKDEASISVLTKFIPIELADSQMFIPEFKGDSIVIYFWATWCGPCIETLKNIAPNLKSLEKEGVQFVPIAYDCSDSKAFILSNNLPYEDLVISERSARDYGIYSLAKQYTFLKDGRISSKNVSFERFYH